MSETIDQQIEKAELTRFHLGLLALGSFIYAFTAMNVLLIATVLTPIIAEFGLGQQPLATGLLLSAGYIGMFAGALTCGALADRIGRKNTIIFTLSIMTVFTALNGFAPDPVTMAILRFVAGIGLGGALPQPGIYISEYVPARYRGRFLGLTEASWVYGALLSLAFPVFLFPTFGWRLTFLISLLPLVLVPVIYFLAPESLRYLEVTGRKNEAVSLLKKHKLVTADFNEENVKSAPVVRRGLRETLAELWSPIFRRRTLMLWVSWAVLVYTYHGIFTWLPTFYYTALGFTVVRSIQWVLIVTLAQIPGYYIAALLLDSVGTWSALYAYTPELYPTRIRGTASGAAASIGRLAGVVAPTATPLLFFYGGLPAAFAAFALVHFAGAMTIALLGIETKGKPLTEISK
jgi:putative MFS transporter